MSRRSCWFSSAALASIGLLALQACSGSACTQGGCDDGVYLSRKLTIASPAAVARVTLVVCLNGACGSAKLAVPNGASAPPSELNAGAGSALSFVAQSGSEFTLVVLFHNPNPTDGDSYAFKLVDDDSGVALLDLATNATYRVLQPNGAACGPTCKSATL